MQRFISLLLLVLICGCGTQQEESAPAPSATSTPYGSVDEVSGYLQLIGPVSQQADAIHREIYKVVGSAGSATGENLARVMQENKSSEKLKELIEAFDQVQPPPLIAPLHRDIKKMLVLRHEWYNTILKGWQIEKESKDTSLYDRAEVKLKEANAINVKVSEELQKVGRTLQAALQKQQQTASP